VNRNGGSSLFMFKAGFYKIAFIIGSLFSSAELAGQDPEARPPLAKLKIFREHGVITDYRIEVSSWIDDRLTEPQWETLFDRDPRFTQLMRTKSYRHYFLLILENEAYWRLARLGVWIRFPESEPNLFYFLPYHLTALEALEPFNLPHRQDLRVDFFWDPLRKDTGGPGAISSHLLRISFRDLLSAVKSDKENLLQVIDRIGRQMDQSIRAKARASTSKQSTRSYCIQFARELGFRAEND